MNDIVLSTSKIQLATSETTEAYLPTHGIRWPIRIPGESDSHVVRETWDVGRVGRATIRQQGVVRVDSQEVSGAFEEKGGRAQILGRES